MADHRRWFWIACVFEATLFFWAAGLSRVLNQPLLADFRWDLAAAVMGLAAVLPLLGLFVVMLRARRGPFVSLRDFLERRARPFFADWTPLELACLSLVAGVSEEVLFRSVLHGGLVPTIGQPLAILVASVAFGVCHAVSFAYAVTAGLVGVFFSGLWLTTGNLLAPVIAHAVYDFLALLYLLRRRPE